MGLTSWRAGLSESYAGPQKWGTGVNPVHAKTDDGRGRVMNPGETPGGIPENDPMVAGGWTPEDLMATGDFGFMDAHPNWGEPATRGRAGDFPSWGHRHGPPSGTGYRAIKRGTNVKEVEAQQIPSETVTEGWQHKVRGSVLDSVVSDPSQYERQTSMQQRDAIRSNGAAIDRSTDVPREPIPSRIVGMKVKTYSGGQRHGDMTPWEQNQGYHRPFRVRGAGTANPELMAPNEMYVATPITRTVPADVNQGMDEASMASSDYGYTPGDYYV